MKHILILALVSIFSFPAHSQALWAILFGKEIKTDKVIMGVDVGVNYSTTTDKHTFDHLKFSFAIGAYTEFKLNKVLSIENYFYFAFQNGPKRIDAEYSLAMPYDSLYNGEIFKRNFQYISVQPAFKYHPTHWFAFGVAPQFNFKVSAKDEYRLKLDKDRSEYTKRLKKEVFWFDFGINFRIQFLFKNGEGTRINLAYNLGVVDVYKNYDLAGPARNASYTLTLGIPIRVKSPLSDAVEKQDAKKAEEKKKGKKKEKKK